MSNIVHVTVYGFMKLNLKKDKKLDDDLQKVRKCYESVQMPFLENNIDRVDRIEVKYIQKNLGKNWNLSQQNSSHGDRKKA